MTEPPPPTARDLLLELAEDGSEYERSVALMLARMDAKISAVMAYLVAEAQGEITKAGVIKPAREKLIQAKEGKK